MDDVALQDAAAVRVAVRVRPLITRELLQGSKTCISTDGPCVTVGRDRRFTFDHAFGPSTQQEQIYQEVVSPLVESCFDGFNVTVLAYGQTGSGKTFTMGTGECGGSGISGCAGGGAGAEEAQQQQLLQHMGIAPRVIRHVFEGIAARRHQASFQVRAQFLEIYNEDVKDLLVPPAEQTTKWISRDPAPGSGGGSITLRDAGDGTILVVGAVEEAAQCAEDLAELLERGMALRATSSTCANEQSSRSHAILTIIIEQHLQPSPAGGSPEGGASVASSVGGAATGLGPGQLAVDGHGSGAGAGGAPVEIRTAKLHLVDLAGSERTKQLRTSMQGPRFRETVNINQGLLALGNVISALGDERRRGSHVPYRESKLTRLLQDSLGGNSRTAMIACISPADDVLEETLNTLKYANRAKNIRNKPVVNRALPGDAQSPLRGAVQQMQLQVLQQLAAQLPDGSLARGLPLAELLALDAADPAACLDVLGRMKSALAASGATSRATSMDGGALGRQLLGAGLHSNRNGDISGGGGAGGAAAEVETLVSGCSRAIAGILHGLAEMEAQGQINREAREHILRSLDASTLRLLPVVRSIGPRSSAVAPLQPSPLGSRPGASPPGVEERGAARGPESELGSEPSADASPPGPGASSERERELEERIRCLESELSSCRAELREAQDDLERDEIIFADKMKELQDAQASSADLKQRLQDSEERNSREVEELRRQVEALQASSEAAQQQQQHLAGPGGRPPGWGPSRAASRGRLRRGSASGSGSGYLPLARRRTGAVPFTTLRVVVGDSDGSAGGSVALAGEDTSGGGGPESAGSRSGGGDAGDGRGGDAGSEDGDGERGGEEDEVLYDEELLSYISETDYTEQHRREVLESDAALREELAEVLREKAAAEAERAALERAAVAQRSSFDEARAALEQQLSWLSGNIGAQQQQLQAAQAAEREARELAAKWQERAQELEAAIEAREEALRRLRSELEAVEGNAMRSGEERAALRQQYEQRIAAVVAQVSTLQRQLQQHASSAATNDRRERQQQSERAAALEAELTRMRTQQAELKRQLSERVARYERESAARVKELAALRKAAASTRSRMAALEQENRAQRLLLRAKQQEVLAAEQRLRDSQRGGGGTGGGGGGTRSRSSSPGCRGYLGRTGSSGNVAEDGGRGGGTRSAPASGARAKSPSPGPQQRPWDGGARRSSLQQLEDIAAEELLPLRSAGAGSNSSTSDNSGCAPRSRQGRQQLQQDAAAAEAEAPPLPPPGPEEQAELTEWAEQLLGLVAEAAGVEARVEVLAVRHQELRARREMLLREQSQFGLRTRRRAEQLAQAVAACEAELTGLAARAAEAEAAAERGGGGGGGAEEPGASAGGDGAAEGEEQQQREAEGQLAALHQRMAEVSHARDVLQARARSGRLLDEREQQVVDSLDDQLDDLETQLSYVAGELADRRAALAQLQRRREQLQHRAREVGPAGLRMALAAATEAVGHRAYQVRQLEAALAASEAGAARREAQLQFRLRESLVSLSAHIASLEATSPSSSVCLDSSELRNLLGIYLDLDLDRDKDKEARDRDPVDREKEREPGQLAPGGGAGLAQGHKGAPLPQSPPPPQQQPGASHAGGHSPHNTRPAAAAPAGSSSGEEDEEQQRQSEPRLQQQQGAAPVLLPELPQADSLGVWGSSSSRPGADGAEGGAQRDQPHPQPQHPQQHQAQQQHQLRPSALGLRAWDGPDLSQQARPPPLHANAAAATGADWPLNGHSHSRSQLPQSHSQQHPQNGSLQDSRMRSTSSTDNVSNGDGSDNSNARLAGASRDHPDGAARGDVATPARAPFSSQPQPQSQPQHFRAGPGSGSGSLGGGAPPSPTAGILRRAGSLESVASVGLSSGSTKRVTWSEQIATDPASAGPPPSPTRSAPSGGSGLGGFGFGGAGGGAGHGGGSAAARGKERSILDRAGSLRAGTVARRGSGSGGTGPGAAGAVVASDEGSVPGGRRGDGVLRPGRDNNPVEARAAVGGVLGGGAAAADVCRGGDESGGGGTRARSGDGDDLAAGNGRGPAAQVLPRASAVPLSVRSSVESDDTVAASDAGAAPDDASGGGVADEAGAAKAGVRSFNPWRDSTTAGGGGGGTAHKQLRTARELYAEPQGQQLPPELLRLSFEADEDVVSSTQPSPRPGGRGNGGVGGVGGEGGLRLAPQGDGLEEALHDIEPGGGGAAASGDSNGLAGGQRQLQPPRQSQWQEPDESQFSAAYFGESSGSGAAGPGRGGTFTSRESRPGGLDPERGAGGNGAEAAAAAWSVCRTDGYDSDGDELEAHVRLLEQAVSAATAVAPPPPRRRPPAPHQGPGRATPTPRGWGSDADGRRAAAAAAADSFGYAVVFDRDSDSDSDIYCVSQGPTPREPAAAHGVPARPPRGRFSLDRPADTGSSTGGGGKGHLARPNNSAPLPLPGPVRSASPVQHHYGRLKHHKPWPGPAGAAPAPAPAAPPAPGPFTTPKPVGAMAALSEALMPYKAHLKRSFGGSGGASGGRADTPEAGRRGAGAGSGVKANFVSPQPQRYQSQGGGSSGGWPPGQDDGGAPTHQQPQRQLQQPWRALGAGQGVSAGAAMVLDGPPYTARQDREERQAAAAALRAAGRNTRFVP